MSGSRDSSGFGLGYEVDSPRQQIAGGVVAFNDERRIERSVRSLLDQELPAGAEWGRIWVVASGCTDRTVAIARSLAATDPRVELVVQPHRYGKSAAIREVLRRAEGDSLVLLNSDAAAAPGSVAALLAKAAGKPRPFAVMARPTVPTPPGRGWPGTMRWMWELHHELHAEMLSDGRGGHLSDELLLVSLPSFPWIEDGIINDGSYCAVWLRNHSGGCWYAPEARVSIETPVTPGDHLRQRRRIHVGNAQVTARLGRAPTTAVRYFLQDPTRALRAVKRAVSREHGVRHLLRVAGWETVSHALSLWDRLPPRRDHVLWSRITPSAGTEPPSPAPSPPAPVPESERDRRIRVVMEVAREFGTGVALPELASLLPRDGPAEPEDLERFLSKRPDLAKVSFRSAYSPSTRETTDPGRVERGIQYRRAAEALLTGPLGWLRPTVRCIGVTGSTAYGAPAPGDDLDFFVVTRAGALPWFLFATFLTLRLRRVRSRTEFDPTPCFNYVVDERRAPGEFSRGRGLLFAREALTARILSGDRYYRGLLQANPWLGIEIPRLYAERAVDAGDTSPQPSPWPLRVLGAAIYPPLAAYLQLVGLRRNAEARRHGDVSSRFRTITEPGRVAFQSERFEQLRKRYQETTESTPSFTGAGAPSRIPTAR